MKPIEIREYSYSSYDKKEEEIWQPLGDLVISFDESEDYEVNEARLYKKGTKYTLITANGCSCWDGDWEGWTNISKTELRKLGASWAKDYSAAEKKIGEWIKENI